MVCISLGKLVEKMNEQKILNHINALEEKHQMLHKDIEQAYKKFERDDIVEEMKREKLRLKDEIAYNKRKLSCGGNLDKQ